MSSTLKIALISMLSIACIKVSFSQNTNCNSKKNIWIGLGAGSNWGSDAKFTGGSVILIYSSHHFIYSVRYLNFEHKVQYDPFDAQNIEKDFSSDLKNYSDIATSLGYILNKRFFKFTASSGLGYFNWKKETNLVEHGPLLSFDTGIIVSPIPVLGLSIRVVSSINSVHIFNTILISVEIGKLW